jgi:hypothetical protein
MRRGTRIADRGQDFQNREQLPRESAVPFVRAVYRSTVFGYAVTVNEIDHTAGRIQQ